jgi:hypothetical protein
MEGRRVLEEDGGGLLVVTLSLGAGACQLVVPCPRELELAALTFLTQERKSSVSSSESRALSSSPNLRDNLNFKLSASPASFLRRRRWWATISVASCRSSTGRYSKIKLVFRCAYHGVRCLGKMCAPHGFGAMKKMPLAIGLVSH